MNSVASYGKCSAALFVLVITMLFANACVLNEKSQPESACQQGCNTGIGNGLKSALLKEAKSIFEAKIQDKQVLAQITGLNEVEEVLFEREDGSSISVRVLTLLPLNDEYTALELSLDPNTANAVSVILRHSDGLLLDVSELTTVGLYGMQIRGHILFSMNKNILYRTDLTTREARPLNNSTYDPIFGQFTSQITYHGKDLFYLVDEDLDILASMKIFFFDNSPPISTSTSFSGQYPYVLNTFYLANGKLMTLWRDSYSAPSTYRLSEVDFTTSGITNVQNTWTETDSTGALGVIDWYRNTYRVDTPNRFTPMTNGFVETHEDPQGQLGASIVYRSMPTDMTGGDTMGYGPKKSPLIDGNAFYWLTTDSRTIKRMEFSATSTEEVVITVPSQILSFEVMLGDVYYTSYITGTNIGTYRIRPGSTTSVLVQSSDMEIRNVVEFNP